MRIEVLEVVPRSQETAQTSAGSRLVELSATSTSEALARLPYSLEPLVSLTLSTFSTRCKARTISYTPCSRRYSLPARVEHRSKSVSICVSRRTSSGSRFFVSDSNCNAAGSFSWSYECRDKPRMTHYESRIYLKIKFFGSC